MQSNIIKEKRYELRMKQCQLAKLLGVTPSYLSQLEKGAKTPSLRMALKLSELLDVDPKFFLPSDVA